MFVVPGWSVSAPLKAQTELAHTPAQTNHASQNGTTHSEAAATAVNPKKRKRGHGKSNGPAVTADNVAELWERHIERKGKDAGKESRSKGPKKRRRSGGDEVDEETKPSGDGGAKEAVLVANGHDPGVGANAPNDKQKKKDKKPKLHPPPTNPPTTTTAPSPPTAPHFPPQTHLTPLQTSMRAKLASARFRHLNQTLYTTPSSHSAALFASNPDMFADYHAGFRQQVGVWPENPVAGYVEAVKARGKARSGLGSQKSAFKGKDKAKGAGGSSGGAAGVAAAGAGAGAGEGRLSLKPLPRTHALCTIADLGCGDALLARSLQPHLRPLNLKLHSFDLHASSPLVTPADIAHLPLPDGSVDVALFCLALMGTNWVEFVDEAWRVLRWRGELWVAEIRSRFGRGRAGGEARREPGEHGVGKKNRKRIGGAKAKGETEDAAAREEALAAEVDGVEPAVPRGETDVSAFVEVLRRHGFVLDEGVGEGKAVDLSNKMFVKMNFVKGIAPVRGKNVPVKKPGEEGTWKRKVKGKIDDDEEGELDETAVLKPCVYKLR